LSESLVVTTEVRIRELLREELAALLDEREPESRTHDDGPLDRTGAAAWLKCSLAKLDALSRRGTDPLPWHLAGDSRRYFCDELRAWVMRQRGGASR
jgi:hypothetical protein